MEEHGYTVQRRVVDGGVAAAWLHALKTDATASCAHSDLLWRIRQCDEVRRVFADVWSVDVDALCAGYDGAHYRAPNDKGLVLDWHVDQDGTHGPGRVCVQALLALTAVNASTGGTLLLPTSHAWHTDLVPSRERPLQDEWEFEHVDENDAVFSKCPSPVQPSLLPGDLLVWDSRLVHRVVPPTDPLSERGVVYLSMVPATWMDARTRRMRRAFYDAGVATTHWVTRCVDRGGPRHPPSRPYATSSFTIQRLVDGGMLG